MSGLGPATCAIGCGQPRLRSFTSGITMVSTMVSIRSVGKVPRMVSSCRDRSRGRPSRESIVVQNDASHFDGVGLAGEDFVGADGQDGLDVGLRGCVHCDGPFLSLGEEPPMLEYFVKDFGWL